MSDAAWFGSDMESDSGRSSVDVPCGTSSDGGASGSSSVKVDSSVETVQLEMRVESLQQENRVLRMELETMRCRCKGLEQEKKDLKRARVNIVSVSRTEPPDVWATDPNPAMSTMRTYGMQGAGVTAGKMQR